jgi:hypothetical protein
MPDYYFSVYEPELIKTMVDALERAWANFEPRPNNKGVARSILARAIINAVETGSTSPDAWSQRATLVLRNATTANPELLSSTPGNDE